MQPTLTSSPKPSIAEEKIDCVTCGQRIEENFCSCCGQPGRVGPISWSNLWKEFSSHWLGMNNSFARTFVHLFTKPEQLIGKYIQGNRVTYLGPLSYYMIVTALVLVLLSIFQVDMDAMLRDKFQNQQQSSTEAGALLNHLFNFMITAFRYLGILILPFYILAVKTLFRNKLNNTLEITVLLLYILSQTFFLTLLNGIGSHFLEQSFGGAVNLMKMLFYGWVFGRLFSNRFSWKNCAKGVAVYFLGWLYFSVFLGLGGLGYLLIIFIL